MDIAMGGWFTCVLSTQRELYCFGHNQHGNLGLGHTNNIGDEPAEMGDYMVATDLGNNFEVNSLSGMGYGMCAISVDGRLKCWGYGGFGQLGQGNSENIGDE